MRGCCRSDYRKSNSRLEQTLSLRPPDRGVLQRMHQPFVAMTRKWSNLHHRQHPGPWEPSPALGACHYPSNGGQQSEATGSKGHQGPGSLPQPALMSVYDDILWQWPEVMILDPPNNCMMTLGPAELISLIESGHVIADRAYASPEFLRVGHQRTTGLIPSSRQLDGRCRGCAKWSMYAGTYTESLTSRGGSYRAPGGKPVCSGCTGTPMRQDAGKYSVPPRVPSAVCRHADSIAGPVPRK